MLPLFSLGSEEAQGGTSPRRDYGRGRKNLRTAGSGTNLQSVKDSGTCWWGSRGGMREEHVESYKVPVMF